MSTHTQPCSATCCQKQIPFNLLMCGTHWSMVPAALQRNVLVAWRHRNRRPGDQVAVRAHEDAKAAAIAAVEAKQNRKIAQRDASGGSLWGEA